MGEIIPNPKPNGTLVDLSQSAENDIHSMTINDFIYPENYRNDNTQNQRKRSIKLEDDDRTPPTKKRRFDTNNNQHSIIPKTESISNRIFISETCLNVNRQQKSKVLSGKEADAAIKRHPFYLNRDGLYYGGECDNENCIAYTQPITVSKGYGTIKPIEDIKSKSIKCPGCSHNFDLKSIYLSNCSATIKYKFFGDRNFKTKQIENIAREDNVKFGDVSQNTHSPKPRNSNVRSTATSNKQIKRENAYQTLEFVVRRCNYDPYI